MRVTQSSQMKCTRMRVATPGASGSRRRTPTRMRWEPLSWLSSEKPSPQGWAPRLYGPISCPEQSFLYNLRLQSTSIIISYRKYMEPILTRYWDTETWVWSLGWEDSLERGKSTHSSILAWRIHGLYSQWHCKESDMTERLSPSKSGLCSFLFCFFFTILCN